MSRRLAPRERRVEIAAAGLFVATAAVMAVARAAGDDVSTAVLLTLCYALMRRVRFQLGPGLIRPTQLVFVPMLFLTPAAAVPLLVALGAVLGELPDLARRRAHPERLLVIVADGWYAVGPALIIAAFSDGNAVDAGVGHPAARARGAAVGRLRRLDAARVAGGRDLARRSCSRCWRSST